LTADPALYPSRCPHWRAIAAVLGHVSQPPRLAKSMTRTGYLRMARITSWTVKRLVNARQMAGLVVLTLVLWPGSNVLQDSTLLRFLPRQANAAAAGSARTTKNFAQLIMVKKSLMMVKRTS